MDDSIRHFTSTLVLAVFGLLAAGSASKPAAAPPKPPYEPNFTYSVPHAPEKIDVTVAIIAPTWTGDGKDYWAKMKGDNVSKTMFSALRASFGELLSNKGFNTTGPFASLDDMTFPDKKAADFVLYGELDVALKIDRTNVRETGPGWSTGPHTDCTVIFSGAGNVNLVVQEPLSKEIIWKKRLETKLETQQAETSGPLCGGPGDGAVPDGWAIINEALYQQVMTGLDKYVNGEEFQVLKKQAAELRAKKVY